MILKNPYAFLKQDLLKATQSILNPDYDKKLIFKSSKKKRANQGSENVEGMK